MKEKNEKKKEKEKKEKIETTTNKFEADHHRTLSNGEGELLIALPRGVKNLAVRELADVMDGHFVPLGSLGTRAPLERLAHNPTIRSKPSCALPGDELNLELECGIGRDLWG